MMKDIILDYITRIYGGENAEQITNKIIDAGNLTDLSRVDTRQSNKWSEKDIYLITYADSISTSDEAPLKTLHQFLNTNLKEQISTVHLLPFYPWSSDDGFSVIDYKEVAEENGSWKDVKKLNEDYDVMADLVINHCSAESKWFENYKNNVSPGKDYFIDGADYEDVSKVVRPRSSSLLTKVETIDGEKHVWCTFSADQVDLNFRNPDVLIEFIDIIRYYMDNGVRIFRMDAIAFLWKESGTSCIHLQQTHDIIKLLRIIIEAIEPTAIIITETNVPNLENLSYFGNNDEAHLIYNFSLPPLLVYSLLSGKSTYLSKWIRSMPPARYGRTYFNFIASHDGIGLRPAEGLLEDDELDDMITTIKEFGGEISMRRMPDGNLKPYEANVSLYSALAGTIKGGKDDLQQARFICAHAIMLAVEGIPAFYIHSLLATENNRLGVAETGHARTINRYKYDLNELNNALGDDTHHQQAVFTELKRLISIRREQPALHPNATQYTLSLGKRLFALWRESPNRTQSLFAIHNISNKPRALDLSDINLIELEQWYDLITGTKYSQQDTIIIPPYGYVWISNRRG